MREPGDVERLVALARSLELGPEDLAKALDALEEDLAGREVERLLEFLAGEGGAGA
jgi:hypothetical protein